MQKGIEDRIIGYEDGWLDSPFQIPVDLFVNPKYQKMTVYAKVLYSILLREMDESKERKWVDQNGNYFVIYTRDKIQTMLNISDKTAKKAIEELQEHELIIDVRQESMNRANRIYILIPERAPLEPRDPDQVEREMEKYERSIVTYDSQKLGTGNSPILGFSTGNSPVQCRNNSGTVPENLRSIKDLKDLEELKDQEIKDLKTKDQDQKQKSGETAKTAAHAADNNSFVPSRQPEKGIYKVKRAHETGNWLDVTFTDVTYYFVHRHNQLMPQTLQLSRQVGYDVKVLRENFFIANDIPLEQSIEAIEALIDKYKKCGLVKREYAGCISFNTFRLPHLMNAIVPGVKTALQRAFNPPSETDDTDYSEAF